ncbi:MULTISPECIES: hypothetical protein [Aeromonas]|uniref:hypothetical protein n=1 Tax=Aeromonas caviae TaxID=648 RepID=UPI002B49FC7E|nr:hypothetical protein [Aeromonas caviae]
MTESIRAALEEKKAKLAAVQSDLDNWEDYDLRREGGSGAQDRRHEEIGESLRNKVWSLTAEIKQLEEQLK